MSSLQGYADARLLAGPALLVLLLSSGCGGAPVHIGTSIDASFGAATVLTGQTVDITAAVTGTNNKSVVWSVCNGSGADCVPGGNSLRGTIAEIGKDAQGNSIARYTAPASVPAPPECHTEASGCSVVLSGHLVAFGVSCFARVTLEPATPPVPTITSLSPSSAVAGGAGFTLTVNGTNFVAGSVARWNGSERASTFVDSIKIQAAIPASDIAAAGTAVVTVFNPPPDGGTSNMAVFNINNPTPELTQLTPSSAIVGGAGFTLTVDGSGFIAASEVQWNGSPRATTFVSSTALKAAIPASDIAAAGVAIVTVFNPAPDGGTSNMAAFNIDNPVPVITSLAPSTALVGAAGFTLTVNGSNLIPSSVVRWNGSDRATTFISTTQLEAAIPASDIAASGTAVVTVFNPPPDGGTSNMAVFNINNPTPALTLLTPSSAIVGGAGFTLTVDGSGFIAASEVQWNGSPRATIFVSSTALKAAIPASDIAAAGVAIVTVFNPPPGGGESNLAVFNINNPAPALSLLTPSSAEAGGAAFMLTATGSGFIAASEVQWNGSPRATAFGSSTELTADIPASDIAAEGAADVTVVNPAPGGGTSNPLSFTTTVPICAGGVSGTTRVSVATDGTEANIGSVSGLVVRALSGTGRYIAFLSDASTLVPGDTNGAFDVFVRDTCEAAVGCAPSTVRVSVASDGTEGNGDSSPPTSDEAGAAINATGRYVVFASTASNLVAGDTNGATDIFVHDRDADENGVFDETCAGCRKTVRVSVASDGSQGTASTFRWGVISDSGRFVAFTSFASNLVAGDTNGVTDVFVHDRDADGNGIFDEVGGIATTRVSLAADGTQGNLHANLPSISATGRFVAFASDATNMMPGGDVNGVLTDVFVRDTCFGVPLGCTPSTVRASEASDGTQGNHYSRLPVISADGRFVAYHSFATNLVAGDTNGVDDVFVRDRDTDGNGIFDESGGVSTVRISLASDGTEGNGGSFPFGFSMSADGRFVPFTSGASNLVAGDTNAAFDVFLRDRDSDGNEIFDETGGVATVRVSVAVDCAEGNAGGGASSISADGRFVVFDSTASNLVANDTNGAIDVFIVRTGVP